MLTLHQLEMCVYREHGCGEEPPGEELQEDDDHCMVHTWFTHSLRLNTHYNVNIDIRRADTIMLSQESLHFAVSLVTFGCVYGR